MSEPFSPPAPQGADDPVTDDILIAYCDFDTNGHAAPPVMKMARELMKARACIREQQAALKHVLNGHTDAYRPNVRATLAKWRIE